MSHDRRVDHADAVAFADDWVTAWNSHDLEKVLSQDFEVIAEITGQPLERLVMSRT
jgi:hypothetical protein